MIKKLGKRGDTLVEVMLAVGIFSMVAVAVVAVMSGGTNSSQTALETTLTREEIDNQAEAIRFIHRAYVADVKNGQNSRFGELWQYITGRAINDDNHNVINQDHLKYNPDTCDELYNGTITEQHGFIINTQQMPDFVNGTADIRSVVVGDHIGLGGLQRAATYPHLIYGNDRDTNSELANRNTTATGENNNLYAAEGIYVMAVGAPGEGGVVHTTSGHNRPDYYDFYIRTCWYGSGDEKPSTISTVIRLYNPDINAAG